MIPKSLTVVSLAILLFSISERRALSTYPPVYLTNSGCRPGKNLYVEVFHSQNCREVERLTMSVVGRTFWQPAHLSEPPQTVTSYGYKSGGRAYDIRPGRRVAHVVPTTSHCRFNRAEGVVDEDDDEVMVVGLSERGFLFAGSCPTCDHRHEDSDKTYR